MSGNGEAPPGTSRMALIEAAAQVFLQDEQVAVNIAGVTTASFVQTARVAYKAAGFLFDDNMLREIHNRLRSLVITRGLGQAKPGEAVH